MNSMQSNTAITYHWPKSEYLNRVHYLQRRLAEVTLCLEWPWQTDRTRRQTANKDGSQWCGSSCGKFCPVSSSQCSLHCTSSQQVKDSTLYAYEGSCYNCHVPLFYVQWVDEVSNFVMLLVHLDAWSFSLKGPGACKHWVHLDQVSGFHPKLGQRCTRVHLSLS